MGDERCVPADDPDANQRLVRESLLDRVGAVRALPPHVLRRRRRLRPSACAWLPPSTSCTWASDPTATPPRCSPARPALERRPAAWPSLNTDPTGLNPHERMTLTYAAIARARLVVFTVSGESKRAVWAQLQAGADLPASPGAAPREVMWIVDHDAAGE